MKKVTPLFPSNLPLKVQVLSSPSFLKIWLEVQLLLPPPAESGDAHYVYDIAKLNTVVTEQYWEEIK